MTCVKDDCDRKVKARGLCSAHYERQRLGVPEGKPLTKRTRSDEEREARYVDKSGGPDACWPWLGARSPAGYARLGQGLAHRWMYLRHVGEIPLGMTIDHVWERGCRLRHCVNPAHLEAVYLGENLRRIAAAAADRGTWRRRPLRG